MRLQYSHLEVCRLQYSHLEVRLITIARRSLAKTVFTSMQPLMSIDLRPYDYYRTKLNIANAD